MTTGWVESHVRKDWGYDPLCSLDFPHPAKYRWKWDAKVRWLMSIEELRLPEEEVTCTSWHFGFILKFQMFKFSSLPMADLAKLSTSFFWNYWGEKSTTPLRDIFECLFYEWEYLYSGFRFSWGLLPVFLCANFHFLSVSIQKRESLILAPIFEARTAVKHVEILEKERTPMRNVAGGGEGRGCKPRGGRIVRRVKVHSIHLLRSCCFGQQNTGFSEYYPPFLASWDSIYGGRKCKNKVERNLLWRTAYIL